MSDTPSSFREGKRNNLGAVCLPSLILFGRYRYLIKLLLNSTVHELGGGW